MGPKLALDLTSGNGEILNEIVKIFQKLGENGLDTLTPVAVYLWGILFVIELVTDWTLYEGNLRMSKIINDIVKGSFFLFIINSWSFFVGAIENFFIQIGMLGGGVNDKHMLGPSDILNRGFNACKELFAALTGTSADAAQNQAPQPKNDKGPSTLDLFFGKVSLLAMLTYLIAIGMIIFAHLWIALQVFICQIEYYVFTTLGLIFIPFGVCKHTNFLFQKTISGLVNFGVKLMGLFFLIAVANTSINIMDTAKAVKSGLAFSDYLKIGLVYLCIAYLIWELPDKLGSLMSGSPTLSGGRLAGAAKAAAGFAVGHVTGAASKTLEIAGDMYETKQMASKSKDGDGAGGQGPSSASGGSNQGARSERAPVYTGSSSGGSSGGSNGGGGGVVFASATNDQGGGRSTAPQYEGQGGGGNTGGAPSGGASGTAPSGDAGAAAPAGGGSGGTAGGGQKGNAAPPPGPEKEWQGTPTSTLGKMGKSVSDYMDGGTWRRFVKYEAEQALAGSILAPWIRGRENAQRRQQKWRAFRDGRYGDNNPITNYRDNNRPVDSGQIRKEWNDLE
ncbi:MAG: type IV secretion system protein [Succiniclasticum sp.]|nr:type IV secretion system protein [Succiniclasticum sp.]